MLNLNHPLSEHIIRAGALQDRIRSTLNMCWFSDQVLVDEETQIAINTVLFKLTQLNNEHFEANALIQNQLDALSDTILCEPRLDVFRKQFYKFVEGPGDNFGTWAI
ncbi:hypothetical protein OT109_04490 [Phycisphaeraceae bacterium D3-23]